MIRINNISEWECDGTIAEIDPLTNEGLEFSIVCQDDYTFSIWIGVSFCPPKDQGMEMDYAKGWHHDGHTSMVAALEFVLEEYKQC